MYYSIFFFFFFQAEDGIRDHCVIGVQTCALPIYILGSASLLLECEEGGTTRRVIFSGDLGHAAGPLLWDPQPPPSADAVIMETTYGDRLHDARGADRKSVV